MTTTVILEGPYAGMTEQEYETTRALDCKISRHLGWYPFENHEKLWGNATTGPDGIWRDDPDGVPFFHADMSTAWQLVEHALKRWRYAAKQRFFYEFQKRASDSGEIILWPDCLISLVSGTQNHICAAFLRAAEWYQDAGIAITERTDAFESGISTEKFVEETKEGVKVERLRITSTGGKAPWVH